MKKIIVINGSQDEASLLNDRLKALAKKVSSIGHQFLQINLYELDIHHCTGCWTCWNKTPGVCMFDDDMSDCLRKMIHADLLIMASPLIMGYPSAIMKRFMDRMIPLVHPYIIWEHGECHHLARYDHYPRMALYVEKESDSDSADINIVRDLFSRAARNLKSDLVFTFATGDDLDEVCNEINHI